MSFFDTYGNNGDIVSQVLSDVLLIQSALSEKVRGALVVCIFSIHSSVNLLFFPEKSQRIFYTVCIDF